MRGEKSMCVEKSMWGEKSMCVEKSMWGEKSMCVEKRGEVDHWPIAAKSANLRGAGLDH